MRSAAEGNLRVICGIYMFDHETTRVTPALGLKNSWAIGGDENCAS